MWREVRRRFFGSDDVPDEQPPRPQAQPEPAQPEPAQPEPESADANVSAQQAPAPPSPADVSVVTPSHMPDRATPMVPAPAVAEGEGVEVSPPGHAPQGLAAEEPAATPGAVSVQPLAHTVAPADATASDAPATQPAVPHDADSPATPGAQLPDQEGPATQAPATLAADDATATASDDTEPGPAASSGGVTAAAALDGDTPPTRSADVPGADVSASAAIPVASMEAPAVAASTTNDAIGQSIAEDEPGPAPEPDVSDASAAHEMAASDAATAQAAGTDASATPVAAPSDASTQQATIPDAAAPQATEDAASQTAVVSQAVPDAQQAESAEVTPDAAQATPETTTVAAFALLDAGAMVGDRYRIVALAAGTDAAAETLTYGAIDTRSYEHCWSCGSTANGPGTRFCQNCGAPVQDHQVTLVQTRAASGDPGEVEHDGAYFHVEPERRQFGAEGMGIEIGAYSAEGPHHPNEDSYWYVTRTLCANSSRQSAAVAVFADGMGGYAPGSGLISSRIAATVGKSIVAALDERFDTPGTLDAAQAEEVVRAAIAQANQMVLDEIARTGEMGATLVTVLVHGDTAYVANVGDSRAYYIDPHGRGAAITRDQSLVAQQVQFGQLTESEMYTAPGNNIILHAIGEEGAQDAADWYTQPLEPGSYLLLCSDGYWKTRHGAVLPDGVLRDSDTMSEAARRMVDLALTEGSDDNTTVVLIAIS